MKLNIFSSRGLLLSLTVACLGLSTVSLARADDPIEPITPPIGPISPYILLSGTFSDLSIKPIASGAKVKVSALVTLRNSGTRIATRVSAKVYLSSSSALDNGSRPIVVLHLADFENGDGKLKPKSKISVPLKYKLPTTLAPGLEGQYIIVVLTSAEGSTGTPIVYGPLPKVL